jgi:hypothetical protein
MLRLTLDTNAIIDGAQRQQGRPGKPQPGRAGADVAARRVEPMQESAAATVARLVFGS